MPAPKAKKARLAPLVLINPTAGSGAGHDAFRHAEHELLELIGDFDIRFTTGRGDAEAFVAEGLRAGARDVIVVGGDGTVNEVVNGWFDPKGEPLAPGSRLLLFGGGTGSDFGRTLGLEGRADALNALKMNKERAVDVGTVTCQSLTGEGQVTRHFLNVASFGLSSVANESVSRFSAMGGAVAYAAATAWSLVNWRNPMVSITYEAASGEAGHFEGASVLGACANGRYFGGGMMVAPEAELSDGALQLILIGDLRRRDIVRLSRHLYDGSHVAHPSVRTARVTHVEMQGGHDARVEVDGDVIGALPATISLAPSKLTLVVPS